MSYALTAYLLVALFLAWQLTWRNQAASLRDTVERNGCSPWLVIAVAGVLIAVWPLSILGWLYLRRVASR